MDNTVIDGLTTSLEATNRNELEKPLLELEKFLTLRTYLSGHSLGPSEKKLWTVLRTNRVANGLVRQGVYTNVTRWFLYIEVAHPEIQDEIRAVQAAEKDKKAAASKAGASYNIGLKDTENGVVTRFPPEPS